MPKRINAPVAFGDVILNDLDASYADDHPWVKAYPSLFVDDDRQVIEAATAAPGERRRGPGRPAKAEPKK